MFKGSVVLLFAMIISVFAGGSAFGEEVPSPFSGGKTYKKYCGMCHGEKNRKAIPSVHDFIRGEYLMIPDREMFQIIREGKKTMPAFIGILSNRQIENVVNYLRMLN